ncbi:unnamed protein product [Closterium sp. NIES-53]
MVHHPPHARLCLPFPVTTRRSFVPATLFLLSPPPSPLSVSFPPFSGFLRAARPMVSHILSSHVTDPISPPLFVSALVSDFASTRRLDYATQLVSDLARPPFVGCASALDSDVLEDKQFEMAFLAATAPHLYAMLLAFEGDPNALDILTPRTYAEAVLELGPLTG